MFSRQERLQRADFETVLKTGKRTSSAHFLAISSDKVKGFAVVIPKKVVRLSTGRHRLKRQILEVLRTIPLPLALLIFPRSNVSGVHYQDIAEELRTLLSKIKD